MTIRFQALLTLFQEFFSTFHHCTCTLSDSDKYLGLEVSASQIQAWFPTDSTQDTCTFFIFNLRDSHPLWCSFPEASAKNKRTKNRSCNTTSPFAFLQRIQFALCCFLSLIITASLLISFPAGTKTLQFPAWAIITDRPEGQEVSFKNLWFNGCMRLPRAYRCLPRSSSLSEPSHPPNGLVGPNLYCRLCTD